MADTDTEMVDSVAGGSRGLEALRTDRGPSWDGKKTTQKLHFIFAVAGEYGR